MSEATKDKPERKRKRKGGVPLGSYNAKMSISDGTIPSDRVGHWINDVENRIALAQNSDWDFVMVKDDTHVGDESVNGNTDIGGKISKIVGTDKTGNPVRAYLMMKYKDWHDDDQSAKQVRNDDIDRSIRTPGYGADEKGLPNGQMYGSVKYKS